MDESKDEEFEPPQSYHERSNSLLATLVYHCITALLLRSHRVKSRTSAPAIEPALNRPPLPAKPQPILGPIIALLQYYSFVSDLHRTLSSIRSQLQVAGIPSRLDMKPVGDDIADVLTRSDLLAESETANAAAPVTTLDGKVNNLETSANAFFAEREELLRVKGEATVSILDR